MFFLAGLSFILALNQYGGKCSSAPLSGWGGVQAGLEVLGQGQEAGQGQKAQAAEGNPSGSTFQNLVLVDMKYDLSNCRRWISSRTPHQRSRTKRNLSCTHSKTNSDDKINNSDELTFLPSTTWSSQARAARDPLQERSLPGDEWRCHLQVRGGSRKVRPSTMMTIGWQWGET